MQKLALLNHRSLHPYRRFTLFADWDLAYNNCGHSFDSQLAYLICAIEYVCQCSLMDPYGPTGTIKLSCIGFHLRNDHWGLNLRGLRMKFHKNVTMFDFAGIPIVANYDNGIII